MPSRSHHSRADELHSQNARKTEYVRPEFVKDLRDQIASFRKFKRLVQQWTDLAIEHSHLKIAAAKKAGKEPN